MPGVGVGDRITMSRALPMFTLREPRRDAGPLRTPPLSPVGVEATGVLLVASAASAGPGMFSGPCELRYTGGLEPLMLAVRTEV